MATFTEIYGQQAGVNPGDLKFSFVNAVPNGWLNCNGAAVSRSVYAALDAAIYVGNTANATAEWGYRCTNASSPSTSRSVSGQFIVLPDMRGMFVRGADESRGIDVGRVFGSTQQSQNLSHTHTGVTSNNGSHSHGYVDATLVAGGSGAGQGTTFNNSNVSRTTNSNGSHTHTLNIDNSGGTESRPINIAIKALIKY